MGGTRSKDGFSNNCIFAFVFVFVFAFVIVFLFAFVFVFAFESLSASMFAVWVERGAKMPFPIIAFATKSSVCARRHPSMQFVFVFVELFAFVFEE